jgi:CubicO group peptidase (beta-lactamase class C family)
MVDAAPGFQYVAVSPGGTLHEHAAGWADLATRRPMDLGTTLMAYSMSKTVTAIAVLQLAEAGALRLDDPVSAWLPEQPYGAGITLRQLLAHIAGVPAPIPLRWVHPRAAHDAFDEAAALAAVLRAHPRPAGPPGRRFRYSNIGYWLLGPVVERASGTPFRTLVHERVLAPLGLAPGDLGYEIPDAAHHASGYLERWSLLNLARSFLVDPALVGDTLGRWVRLEDHYVNGPAFGGLVGTARAFGRLLQDQLAPRSVLLDAPSRRLLAEPQRLDDGREVPMTPGWHVARRGTRRVLFKEGGGGGFRCMMRLYPDDGIGTVLMTNATSPNVGRLLDRLDAPFLARSRT